MKAEGVAVVTGASRGLGRAVALRLAACGFEVEATMRDPAQGATLPEELARTAPPQGPASVTGSIRAARLDVDDPDSIELPSGLNVLVNNAGVERRYLPLEATPMNEWREVFETNVFGLVEVTRRAVPLLRANGGGVICNITSSSVLAGAPFYSVYRASKAAVEALGESLRTEVGPFGIRIVEIMPGPVATDMLANSARLPEAAEVPGYEALAEAAHQGRLAVEPMVAPVEEAARAVVEAILSDDPVLRWPCDELGSQLLSAWRKDPESMF